MIRSDPGRIVSVVGGYDKQVALAELGQHFERPFVEGLKSRGIAGYISPMTELAVEVDKICKDQITVAGIVHRLRRQIE